MNAKLFIEQSVKNIHKTVDEIIEQPKFLKALNYFGDKGNELYDEFIYLNPQEQNTFLKSLSKLLPLSQRVFSMFIEQAKDKDDIATWLKEANDIYLRELFKSLGGTSFEDTYEDVEDEIFSLNEKLEQLGNNYLLNTKKRESLKKELEETIQKNTQEIQEIENLEKQKHSLETTVNDYTLQIATSKQEVKQLETQISSLKEELKSFTTTKESYEQELHTLSKKQQEHSTKVQEIAKEIEKLQDIEVEYEKAKAILDAMKKSIESKQEDIDIVKNRYQHYTDKDAKEIQKKLKEIDEYLQALLESHSIVTQEDKMVNKAKNR